MNETIEIIELPAHQIIGNNTVEPVRKDLGQDGVLVVDVITDHYVHITERNWVALKEHIDKMMGYYNE